MFFKARRNGTIKLQLDPVVRAVITNACTELRVALTESADDPTLRRLFPPAYVEDAARQSAYEALVRDDLVESRLHSVDTVLATVDGDSIDAEQAQQWLHALNAMRLALGTQLDVSEDRDPYDIDEDDPRLPQFLVYDLLSAVLGALISAVTRQG